MKKEPVLGNLAKIFRIVFLSLTALCVAVFVPLAILIPEGRISFLCNLAGEGIAFLALSWIIPVSACYGRYGYTVDEDGITLYRKEEKIRFLAWDDAEIALGSVITKGSDRNPVSCVPAVCMTEKGKMRDPQCFPKRALTGADGEICISCSVDYLRQIRRFYKGRITANPDPVSCRLSVSTVHRMQNDLRSLPR